MRLDVTEEEARLMLALLEACDDADPPVKRPAITLARYLRRRLEAERRDRMDHET